MINKMLKGLCALALAVTASEASALTLYYDNSATGWSNVNAYCWNDAGGAYEAWPGAAMEEVDGETDLWEIEIEDSYAKCIFNNGSSQTGDLTAYDGYVYNQNGPIATSLENFKNGVAIEVPTYTIYFDNSEKQWDTPYVYCWTNSANNGWPGQAMTKVEDVEGQNNLWKYESEVQYENCLFNAGDGDNSKTGDFVFQVGYVYDATGVLMSYATLIGEVETPIVSMNWTAADGFVVTIEDATEGAEIYYEIVVDGDGSDEYTLYDGSFSLEENKEYEILAYATYEGKQSEETVEHLNTKLMTLTCILSEQKEHVYCYTWLTDNTRATVEPLGSWPGTEATASPYGDYYIYTATTPTYGKTLNAIFNDNDDWQTNDIENATEEFYDKDGGVSGVADVCVDAAAEAEYYTLQGVRVAAPAQGLYIVVRGNNVTKEYVR